MTQTEAKLAKAILKHDEAMGELRHERADCVQAWERATGRRWVPGPPTPPEPPDDRPVA